MLAMGVERGIVACGNGSMDEITNTGVTRISEIKNGTVETYDIKPEDFGIDTAKTEDIVGGDCTTNAQYTKDILNGVKGPKRDIVLLNAGAAIYVAGIADTMADGIKKAEESIDSGKAKKVLEKLVEFTSK